MEVNNTTPQAAPASGDSGGMGFFFGMLLLVVFVFLLVFYGIPVLRNAAAPAVQQQPSSQAPAVPDINIPDKVDINVNQDK